MKLKPILLAGSCLVLLSACGNLDSGVTKVDQGTKTKDGEVTTGGVDASAYQAILSDGRYQPSAARSLNAANLNSGYNQGNFENGLLRLSQKVFSPKNHLFQEGQKLDEDTIKKWLARSTGEGSEGLNASEGPIIFQQLMENDFYEENGQKLAGMSLAFAFNSVYYENGRGTAVSRDEIMANARKTVNTILTRVRQMQGLDKVPILVALFEQSGNDSIMGGTYIYSAVAKDGGTTIDTYEPVNEEYLQLPAAAESKNTTTQDGVNTKFVTFRDAVQGFFPNLAGVSGKAYYADGQLQNLTINIESKYYSKTEITSFTQYIGKQVASIFESSPGQIEVQINDLEGPQAFVAKKSEQKDIISYIFN